MPGKFETAQDVKDSQILESTGDALGQACLDALDMIYAKVPDYVDAKAKFADPNDLNEIGQRKQALIDASNAKIAAFASDAHRQEVKDFLSELVFPGTT